MSEIDSNLLNRARLEARLIDLIFYTAKGLGGRLAYPDGATLDTTALWFGADYAPTQVLTERYPWREKQRSSHVVFPIVALRRFFPSVHPVTMEAGLHAWEMILVPHRAETAETLDAVILATHPNYLRCTTMEECHLLWQWRIQTAEGLRTYAADLTPEVVAL